MFYTYLSVILFTVRGGGCLPQCMLVYTPLGADTLRSRHPAGADTPQEQTPPGADTPLGADTPPAHCMLGDTGNKRAVRILLECIFVKTVMTP